MSFDNIPSVFSSSGNIRSALKIPLGTNYANINYYFSQVVLFSPKCLKAL